MKADEAWHRQGGQWSFAVFFVALDLTGARSSSISTYRGSIPGILIGDSGHREAGERQPDVSRPWEGTAMTDELVDHSWSKCIHCGYR